MAMGAAGEEDILLYCSTAPVEALEKLKKAIAEVKPLLVIIDPLFRFVRVRDSNDYAEVTRSLEPVLSLARESGTHVLCVHHLGKGDRSGGDAILGSTAIFGAVDTVLLLKRSERYRTISSDQRYGQNLEETVLDFDPATKIPRMGGTKEEEERSRVQEAILVFLKMHEEPQTEKEIGADVEGRTSQKRKALRDLLAAGEIVRHGKGGKKDPFTYSCSHVPPKSGEHENKNPENDVTGENNSTYSCSQDFSENDDFGDEHEDFGNMNHDSLREVFI
jgi:hypothetical protein